LEAARCKAISDGGRSFDERGEAGAVGGRKEEDRGGLVEDVRRLPQIVG
jgi:hypothetical protein